MATSKVIGTVEVAVNGVKIIGVDGLVRDAVYGASIHEGEQIISTNPDALVQVRYLALSEPASYEGVFRVLADGSVITGSDVMDSIVSDKNLADIFQTAAGEGDIAESSGYFPSDIVAKSSVLGFGRDDSGPLSGSGSGVNVLSEASDTFNNNAPVIDDVAIAATEDVPTNITGVIPGSDADGNAFTYHIVDGLAPGEGSITLNPDGSFIYNIGTDFQYLAQGETTQVTFTYQASEVPGSPPIDAGPFDSNIGTMTITVTGTNDQPVVTDINANSIIAEQYDIPGEIISTSEGEGGFVTVATGNIVQIADGQDSGNYDGPGPTVSLIQESGSIDYWHFTHNGGPLTIDMLTEYGNNYVDVNGDGTQSSLDSYIYLYHDSGSFDNTSFVASNDDSDADGIPNGDNGEADGSTHSFDSYLDFNDLPTGNYVLVVGGFYLNQESIQNGINTNSGYAGPYQITFTSEGAVTFNTTSSATQVIYETHDNDAYQNGVDDTQGDALVLFTGSLDTVQDVDLIDTHTYYLVDNDNIQNNQVTTNVLVDSTGTSLGINATVQITDAVTGTYQIEGDFTNLADGEQATVTFAYVAVDNSDDNNPGDRAGLPIAPNESDTSAPATVTLTITGTNDQPIVDNITVSALETHDDDAYQNNADDTQDDELTNVSGTLLATDDDVNNTHIFDAVSMGGNDNGGSYEISPQFALQSIVYNPTSTLDSVDYYQNGENGHPQTIEVLVESTNINPNDIDVTKLIFTSNDGADSEAAFELRGDYNALGAGETATVTFKYIADDQRGFGTGGDSNNEASVSEEKTVTITLTGTNDQPIVSDIVERPIYESHDNDAYQNGADDTQADVLTTLESSLATVVDDDVNDTHTYLIVDDSLGVVTSNGVNITDLDVTLNPNTGDYTLSGNFNALATGERATITFQYQADDGQGFGAIGNANNEASLSEPKTVTITVMGTNDQPIVSDIVRGDTDASQDAIYETHDDNAYQNNTDDTQDDVLTRVSGTLLASDDDVTDTHIFNAITMGQANPQPSLQNVVIHSTSTLDNVEYYQNGEGGHPQGIEVLVESNDINPNDIDVTKLIFTSNDGADSEAAFEVRGDFNALSDGESATVTFKYYADDQRGFGLNDVHNEDSVSEPKTVTITITGTNDQPIVSDIVRGNIEAQQDIIYESHDDDAYRNHEDDTQDDVLTTYDGNLATALDDDVNNTHIYQIVGQSLGVETPDGISVTDLSVTLDSATGNYTLGGDFNALTAGETATVTFQYVADDQRGFGTEGDANNEASISEPKTVTLIITGTNDQPIVENVAVNSYESHDNNAYQNSADDTQDDETTVISGTLLANDDDVNNTHVFNIRDMHGNDTNNREFVDVDFYKHGVTNNLDQVTVKVQSSDISPEDISLQSIIFLNNNAADSQIDFEVKGDFNALGANESATVTFKYIANDREGFGANGDSNNEASLSEPKFVTITIMGTNDQPIIEGIETTNVAETALGEVIYGTNVNLDANDLIQTSGADAQEGSAIKVVLDSAAGETVTFDWAFDSRDADYMHDTAFVIVDGVVSTLAEGAVDANGTFTYTFATAGEHTIVAGVLNNHDDQGYGGSSLLTLNNLQGGVLLGTESFGAVSGNGVDGYDLSANSNLPVSELGSFIDMQSTSYENAHLNGSLEDVIAVSDDDVNDDYSYVAFNDRIVDFTEESSGVPLITTPIRVSLDENGNYDVVSTSFDKLGEGESVTVTFDVQVRDDSGINDNGDANNEAALSESKTVTIVINGTNDSPVLAAVTTSNAIEPDLTGLWNIFGTEIPEDALLSGQLNASVSDEDVNDSYSFVAQGSYTYGNWSPAFATVSDTNGVINWDTYIKVNEDGSYKVFNPDFNHLGTGESVTVSFDVQVQDDSGVGTGDAMNETSYSNTQTVTLSVTGTNDQPVVTNVHVSTWEAQGSGATSITGGFFGHDEDTNDVLTYNAVSMDRNEPVTDIAGANFVRVMNVPYDADGNGVYESNVDIAVKLPHGVNANDIDITGIRVDGDHFTLEGDFNALPQHTGMVVKFLYNATDDSGANVTNGYDESDVSDVAVAKVIIHGTNDIADISVGTGQDSGEVAEDTIFTVDGQLGVSDLDAGEAFFNTTVTVHPGNATAYGTLSIDANGTWEYVLNNDAAQVLNAGEIAVEKFIVFSLDGTDSQIIEISIHGMNDAPVLEADVNSVIEAGVGVPEAANLSGNVLDNDNDVDHGASLAVVGIASDNLGTDDISFNSNDRLVLRGEYGRLSMDENGNYSYNLLDNDSDTDALKQGEEANDVFTYRVSDGQGGFDTQTLTIHITGTNDAPIINEFDSDTTALEFAGLNGEYYGVDSQIHNLAQFQGIVAGNDPDATFRAADISYGENGVTTYPGISGGRDISTVESLQTFLGDDANTLSRDPGDTSDGGVRMSGAVYLAAGTYNFQVTADDGYQIMIDGNSVAEFDNNQSPTTRTHYYFTIDNDGYHSVDMLWWDQGGEYIFKPQLRMGDGEYQTFSSDNFAFTATAAASVIEAGTTDSGAEVAGVDTVSGTMVASDVDHDASLTWSVDDPDDTYGSFGIDANTGQWTYVLDNSLAATDALQEGERVTQTFNVVVTDEFGATDTQAVTINIQGTNDAPVATADVVTKITDHVEYDEVAMDAHVIGDGFELTTTSSNGTLWYGIDDSNEHYDNPLLIDSHGEYNEGISFTTLGEATSATVSFRNAHDNLHANDNIVIALYLDGDLVANVNTSTIGNSAFEISGYGSFDEIRISAEDMEHGYTQFRVSQIVIADDVSLDTVLPFIIDDSMLLANDSDVDNHSDLSLVINDTSLYAVDNSIIGTVGLDGDGNVLVIPNSMEEFNSDEPAYAHFNYSVVDEHGAQSNVTTATIDVAHGSVADEDTTSFRTQSGENMTDDEIVSYTQTYEDEFIIGTDTDTTPDAFEQNLLIVDDDNTLDLSHIAAINTIELGSNSTVTGTGDGSPLATITASDVISATDTDNTLIINSADTNAADQVSVDTSTLAQGSDINLDGMNYESYSGGSATLLIQIDDVMDDTDS